MTVNLDALVACPGFRWMPGMQARWRERFLGRVVHVEKRGLWLAHDLFAPVLGGFENCHPDLDDQATCGCLLALVREAWGDHYEIRVSIEADGVEVSVHWSALAPSLGVGIIRGFLHKTLGPALVAALLAAPPTEASDG